MATDGTTSLGIDGGGTRGLSLVGGLADAIAPWLPPDLRACLRRPDADTADGALPTARRWIALPKSDLPKSDLPKDDLPKRQTDHEQASKFCV
jgi:glucosamine kinase